MGDFQTSDENLDGQPAPTAGQAEDNPPADPYGLGSITFADLSRQPGDGVFSGVMRQMAANGHPVVQEWAARDAARNGGDVNPAPAPVRQAMTTSPQAMATIRTFEAPGGSPPGEYTSLEKGTPTRGIGHKGAVGGDSVSFDPEAAYRADIRRAEGIVKGATITPLDQHQFDGLVSFAFNEPGAFRPSSAEKPNAFLDALNQGNFAAAAKQMLTHNTYFDHDRKERIASGGIQRRRFHEADMFSNGIYRPF